MPKAPAFGKGSVIMEASYLVLMLSAVTAAGLGGSLLGWLGASAATFFERWEPTRRAAVFMHLCDGQQPSS
jgi:hypothetical protein